MGNIHLPEPKGKKIDKSASEFLVDKVSENPGEVSILALGSLTNLAMAIKRGASFASKVKRIVVLGGAFFASGNVNPAAEANIYGDPEAADVVFMSGANVDVVGINITTQIQLTDGGLFALRNLRGRYARFISDMCGFYWDWHVKSDGVYGIFLHDPVSFMAMIRPDFFTFKKGVVRVETQGICVGHTDGPRCNVVRSKHNVERQVPVEIISAQYSQIIPVEIINVPGCMKDGILIIPGQVIQQYQLHGQLTCKEFLLLSRIC